MEFLIISALILLNGVFAMSEIAVISARKTRLASQANTGSSAAKAALKLAENPDRFLSTVQVGITLIGIVTGLYSGDVLAARLSPLFEKLGIGASASYAIAQILIVAAVTYFTIIFGELVPKRIGMTAAENIAKIVARPMYWLSVIAWPFVWVLSKSTSALFGLIGISTNTAKVTEDEIKSLIREGAQDGEVRQVEKSIMERALMLGDRNIESIMTHRSDIIWLEEEMSRQQIKETIRLAPFDKYPVRQRKNGQVTGIASLKDMFLKIEDENFSLSDTVRPADYFYENMDVYSAMEKMKAEHVQCALVCDEFGEVKGMVTLKDIMEALVGQIAEAEEEPEIIVRSDGSILADGQCSFYNFLCHFDLGDLYQKYEYNTISGLILDITGRIPETGETVAWNGFEMEIADMDGTRIDKIIISEKTAHR